MEILAKGLTYDFNKNDTYDKVQQMAIDYVKEMYEDTAEDFHADFQYCLENDPSLTLEQFIKDNGEEYDGINYEKDFEENQDNPIIQNEINENTNKFLYNAYNLPNSLIVSVPDKIDSETIIFNAINDKIKEKYGTDIKFSNFTAAKEAKKMDILKQKAFDKIEDMIDSGNYQKFLELRQSIGKYSRNNMAMIYYQKPTAKAVMPFTKWKNLDRYPTKDTGIEILSPCKYIMKSEADVDKYLKNHSVLNKDSFKKKALKHIQDSGVYEISFFKPAFVFDITDTVPKDKEHDNLEEIMNLDKPLTDNIENYENVIDIIQKTSIMPFELIKGKSEQDILYNSISHYVDNVLSTMPEKVQGIKSNIPYTGDLHIMETAMATQMICSHLGLNVEDKTTLAISDVLNKKLSKDIILNGKREMFLTCSERAGCLSDQFSTAFDKEYKELIQKSNKEIKKEKSEIEKDI